MARLEANCDEYLKELFVDTNIDNSFQLSCAVSYTCGRIVERGRTVPYWYEEYGHDLMCRLLALYNTGALSFDALHSPKSVEKMLLFLYEEAPYPLEVVMNKFNILRHQL